jgi:hypothetical protein
MATDFASNSQSRGAGLGARPEDSGWHLTRGGSQTTDNHGWLSNPAITAEARARQNIWSGNPSVLELPA